MIGNITQFANLVLILVAGLGGGMIINYLADFLPTYRRLITPRCLKCNAEFGIRNYFVFPRACPSCNAKRSARVWMIEIAAILVALWLFLFSSNGLPLIFNMLIVWYFILVIVIDVEHRLILHVVSISGAILGVVAGSLLHGLWETLIGGAAGFLIMLLIYYAGFGFIKLMSKLRKASYSEEALGFGDVNLSGVVGLFIGWPGVIGAILLAILLAGGISLLYLAYLFIIKKYQSSASLPYGPFLAISALLLLFLKDYII